MVAKISPIGRDSGKGGNFTSRPNPFDRSKGAGSAPECVGAVSFGMAIDEVLRAGCAVMFGHTRDGGALVCTILDGEARHRSYASNSQELDDMLLALHNTYGED